jgi:hypothetical protein
MKNIEDAITNGTVTWHSVLRKIDKGGTLTVVEVFKSGVHSEAFEMETLKPPTERAIRSALRRVMRQA